MKGHGLEACSHTGTVHIKAKWEVLLQCLLRQEKYKWHLRSQCGIVRAVIAVYCVPCVYPTHFFLQSRRSIAVFHRREATHSRK